MSVILTDEMLEFNTYRERYEASKRARETFRVDQGRLCTCDRCGQSHYVRRKEDKETKKEEK